MQLIADLCKLITQYDCVLSVTVGWPWVVAWSFHAAGWVTLAELAKQYGLGDCDSIKQHWKPAGRIIACGGSRGGRYGRLLSFLSLNLGSQVRL